MSKTTTWVKISDVVNMIMAERDTLDYKHGYTREMYKQLADRIVKAAAGREIDVTEVTEDEAWSE